MSEAKEEYVILSARLTHAAGDGDNYDVIVSWTAHGIGFGETTFIQRGDRLEVQTECMGKDFVRAVLTKLLDDAVRTE